MNVHASGGRAPAKFSYLFRVSIGCILLVATVFSPSIALSTDSEFRVAIMQPQKGAAQKYRSLEAYLQTQGINISFIGTSNYLTAAKMFAAGEVDGMFSGSGVAGSMLIKDVAVPVLRPEDSGGISTYWAVVIAPKGSVEFTETADYFLNKKIILCGLATSGEFYYRSIPGIDKVEHEVIIAPSHGAALLGLSKGIADVAIVKNRVWDSMKNNFPNLQQVGHDNGENPNGTLIVSKQVKPELIKKLTTALYAIEILQTTEAKQVRADLAIRRYIATGIEDFSHTLSLLRRAGVTKDFTFEY